MKERFDQPKARRKSLKPIVEVDTPSLEVENTIQRSIDVFRQQSNPTSPKTNSSQKRDKPVQSKKHVKTSFVYQKSPSIKNEKPVTSLESKLESVISEKKKSMLEVKHQAIS